MSDPVTTELIRSALQYAAEDMGLAARNAAYSPNIKERLDLRTVRLQRGCEIVDDVESVILATWRTPHVGEGDLKAQIAGNMVGERRVLELLEEDGAASYADALPAMMGLSEVRLRRAV